MSLWNLIKNTVIEAIDTVLEGLEPYEYATLPTKASIRLLILREGRRVAVFPLPHRLRARSVAALVVHMGHSTPVEEPE
jgi:hypothetical protein